MERDIKSRIHFHICWSDSSIDWKAIPTKEEAAKLAEQIKKATESYVIVERDGECERCKAFRSQFAQAIGRRPPKL